MTVTGAAGFLGRAGVCFVLTAWSGHAEAAAQAGEVWISAKTNALNTGMVLPAEPGAGSVTNPYYGDFDAILNSLPGHTTVHLLPGTHYTKGYEWRPGDLALKSGQRVLGAGIDTTTVAKDNRWHPDDASVQGILWSRADGIEIRDLTVNCSGGQSNRHKIQGISLAGSNCKVQRVKVIGAAGNWAAGDECFVISLGGGDARGDVISECEVSSVRGTYFDAMVLVGQGEVRNNRVLFPLVTNKTQGFLNAYQFNGTHDSTLAFNYSEGGVTGFYTDTLGETNLSIVHNTFCQVGEGIVFWKGGAFVTGIGIKENNIEISTNLPPNALPWGYAWGITLRNLDTNSLYVFKDIEISRNRVSYFNEGGRSGNQNGITAIDVSSWSGPRDTNLLNVRVLGNIFDRSSEVRVSANGAWFADNVDLRGIPLHLREVGPGSSAAVTLTAIDGTVLVSSTATTKVTLCATWGLYGKEVTIVNDKSTGELVVHPPDGARIVPSSPVTLPPYQAARFVSDGVATWVKL